MKISDELAAIKNQLAALTDAIAAQSGGSGSDCCPQIMEDENGGTIWVDPPGTIDISYPPRPASASHGDDIGYGDVLVAPPSSTGVTTWPQYDDALCAKSTWFVSAGRDCLEEMQRVWNNTNTAISWVAIAYTLAKTITQITLVRGWDLATTSLSAIGERSIWFVRSKEVYAMITRIGLQGISDIFHPDNVILEHYDAIAEDLKCAIYMGKDPRGIKSNWDAVVEASTTGFAPQRFLFKRLLDEAMAEGLARGSAEELPGGASAWPSDCSGCTNVIAAIPARICSYNGSVVMTAYIIPWPYPHMRSSTSSAETGWRCWDDAQHDCSNTSAPYGNMYGISRTSEIDQAVSYRIISSGAEVRRKFWSVYHVVDGAFTPSPSHGEWEFWGAGLPQLIVYSDEPFTIEWVWGEAGLE